MVDFSEYNKTPEQIASARILFEWGRLYRLSNQKPPEGRKIDVIIVPTGDGRDRIPTALNLWEKYAAVQVGHEPLLIPSGLVASRGWKEGEPVGEQTYTSEWMKGWFMENGVPEEMILTDPKARHTREMADNSLAIARAQGAKTGILTAPQYYLPRAILTMIASMMDSSKPWLRLYAHPCEGLAWNGHVPDAPETRFRLIPGEMERIYDYRERGQVASEHQLHKYVAWIRS